MNTRDRVHFASQDSVSLNSLAILRLNDDEYRSIGTHYRLAITNGVGRRFVLRCQKPDCYKETGRAGPRNHSDGLGKRVAVAGDFYQLRSEVLSVLVEDGSPQTVGVKIGKKRLGIRLSVSGRFFI